MPRAWASFLVVLGSQYTHDSVLRLGGTGTGAHKSDISSTGGREGHVVVPGIELRLTHARHVLLSCVLPSNPYSAFFKVASSAFVIPSF